MDCAGCACAGWAGGTDVEVGLAVGVVAGGAFAVAGGAGALGFLTGRSGGGAESVAAVVVGSEALVGSVGTCAHGYYVDSAVRHQGG